MPSDLQSSGACARQRQCARRPCTRHQGARACPNGPSVDLHHARDLQQTQSKLDRDEGDDDDLKRGAAGARGGGRRGHRGMEREGGPQADAKRRQRRAAQGRAHRHRLWQQALRLGLRSCHARTRACARRSRAACPASPGESAEGAPWEGGGRMRAVGWPLPGDEPKRPACRFCERAAASAPAPMPPVDPSPQAPATLPPHPSPSARYPPPPPGPLPPHENADHQQQERPTDRTSIRALSTSTRASSSRYSHAASYSTCIASGALQKYCAAGRWAARGEGRGGGAARCGAALWGGRRSL